MITYGVTGLLVCRDALTGRALWKNEVSQTYGVVQNFFGVGAAPMVAGDLVVVMVGGSPPEDQDLPRKVNWIVSSPTEQHWLHLI